MLLASYVYASSKLTGAISKTPGYIVCFAVSAIVLFANIDQSNAQYSSQYYGNSYFSNSDQAEKYQRNRLEELSKQPIPRNEISITRELDRIDTEIVSLGYVVKNQQNYRQLEKQVDDITGRIKNDYYGILQSNCDTGITEYKAWVSDYYRYLETYRTNLAFYNLQDATPLYPPTKQETDQETCKSTKSFLQKKDKADLLEEITRPGSELLANYKSEQSKIVDANETTISALNKRRQALQEALNSTSPQQQITASLPFILMIIGGAAVLAIVGVRLFDAEIQMEWVASGQVIQFVTVMILLSVITALALSNVLKETSLGTLLGGIAGYVRAQGVGRAAARDVARNVRRSDRRSEEQRLRD